MSKSIKTFIPIVNKYCLVDEKKNKINDTNTIFYGESLEFSYGIILNYLKHESPSSLNYYRSIQVNDNLSISISDIHYELDVETIGCNIKTNYCNAYDSICDIIDISKSKKHYFVIKNFHKADADLYDLIQSNINNKKMVFFIITKDLSCLCNSLISSFEIHQVPYLSSYYKNKYKITSYEIPYFKIFNKLLTTITDKSINYTKLRTDIYDLLIYQYRIHDFINYLFDKIGYQFTFNQHFY